MYRDPKQWTYIRRLILEKGHSRKGVARKTGLSRTTIRKMLESPRPPREAPLAESAQQKLLEAAQILAAERFSSDPSVYRRRTLYLWGRARDLVLKLDRCRGAALLREIAELISGDTAATEADARAHRLLSRPSAACARGVADRHWMDRLLRGATGITEIEDLGNAEMTALLLAQIKSGSLRERKKAVVVLAHRRGVSIRTIAGHLSISRVSARKYVRAFANGGLETLFAQKKDWRPTR
jgi:transposase